MTSYARRAWRRDGCQPPCRRRQLPSRLPRTPRPAGMPASPT